ncbi:MAG: hypothetical protein ACI36X_09400 [Bacteroidaceae bacterium]
MNKKYLIGTWTALMLASCSGDDGSQPSVGNEFTTEGTPEMVQMSAHAASVSTKGYGTVGDVAGATNLWRSNQAIYLYAVTSNYANVWSEFDNRKAYVQPDNNVVYFGPHTPAPNPEENMGLASYYELGKVNENNSYWFYGYHVDDAATMGTNAKGQMAPVVNMGSTLEESYIDLTIDGTQDIMVAKNPENPFAGNPLLDGYRYGYSAYTSRRNATPDLVFNHCLTRFTIEAIAADANAEGIRIDEMSIYSKTKAKLYFMKPADESLVPADNDNDGATWLKLKKYDAATNTMVDLNPAADCTLAFPADQTGRPIGDGIICMPKKTSTTDVSDKYVLRITQTQEKNGREEHQTFNLPIQRADGTDIDFQSGYSYKLSVTFHGFTAVRVTATLTPWNAGEDIPMDPDDLL